MPKALKKPCLWPGCPELIHRTEHYCVRHTTITTKIKKAQPKKKARAGPRERGYSPRWDRFSVYMRRKYPVCQLCDREFSAVVDHIVPKSQGGQDTEIACWCLCKRCHDKKTARFDGGGGRRISRIYCGKQPHNSAHMGQLKQLLREELTDATHRQDRDSLLGDAA